MENSQYIHQAKKLYPLTGFHFHPVMEHPGGRNRVLICENASGEKQVLRISPLPDRTETDFLAETEFVHYLAQNGAPVADVIPSNNGRLFECVNDNGKTVFFTLFEYAQGMLLSDHGYRYRENAPLEEYFFNTGKTLGILHRLSKAYVPLHQRFHYKDKYNEERLDALIPSSEQELKNAIFDRLRLFRTLPADPSHYGLIHFDFSDGNYHIDMSTGRITVYDFDNCMNCWYMFDLANLWTHGEGWCRHISNADERMSYMRHYFDTILAGYRTETDISDDLLTKLTLFIDMVLIENIVDEFECCARNGELPEEEDIHDAAECLIKGIPYVGIGMMTTD